MKTIPELLCERELPELLIMRDGTPVTRDNWPARRAELLDILQQELYGVTPAPCPVEGKIIQTDERYCAGKVRHDTVDLTLHTPYGDHTFPVQLFRPKANPNAPVFLHICFRPDFPDRYSPIEEITDHGFAFAMFDYNTVATDDGDFTNGLGGLYVGDRKRRPHEWGKLGMWAYAASRVLDWLETIDGIDAKKVTVTGHSRLGKTALWCAAQDERFFCGISNDSGCGGAAIERGKVGERTERITEVFPFWFCPRYKDYSGHAELLPFDHHFIVACVAPRYCYIASAEEDLWADPASEYLSAAAGSAAYELLGLPGVLPVCETMPTAPAEFHDGTIGYHVRKGLHYYGREDWLRQMAFLEARV
ncbi:MAG: acetylxylan esterase [Clostridiales bacterium]|nr:acetylxylan esterase [Clostridiales bacterium]